MIARTPRSLPIDFAGDLTQLTGGEAGTSIGLDATDYVDNVPPAHVGTALWLEAARMARLVDTTTDDDLALQRAVVAVERGRIYQDDPSRWVRDVARVEVFGPEHPYATTSEGIAREIDAVTLDEVRSLASRYYRPDNANLVVTGAFDPDTVRALTTRYFEPIPPAPSALTRRTFPPVRVDKSRTVVRRARLAAPIVVVGWPAPRVEGDGHAELEIARSALDSQLAYSQGALTEKAFFSIEPGRLSSFVTAVLALRPNADPAAFLELLDRDIAAVSDLGRLFEWENFQGVKTQISSLRFLALQDQRVRARRLADDLDPYRDDPVHPFDRELRRIDDMASADVGTAVLQFLHRAPRVVVVAMPDAAAPPLAEAL